MGCSSGAVGALFGWGTALGSPGAAGGGLFSLLGWGGALFSPRASLLSGSAGLVAVLLALAWVADLVALGVVVPCLLPCGVGCQVFILSSYLLVRQYHFVNELLNWTEAKTYCRQKYTDLVTMENSEEMERVMSTVVSAGYNSDFWIGLYSEINWTWSDGFTGSFTGYTYWSPEDPFHSRSDQICMTWRFYPCERKYPFICHGSKGEFSIILF
uniref:C-type lectin domain-containing protein n=1 Tax=Oryzias latipes TaxID=8090 RepID=A0A3B3HLV0_ORYLA